MAMNPAFVSSNMSAGDLIPLESLGSSRTTPHGSFPSSETDIISLRSRHDAQQQYEVRQTPNTGEGESNGDHRPKEGDLESPINYIDALPPVDGGRQAWSYLVAATILETLIWGLPFTVGIFHEYWTSTLFKEQGGDGVITLASTLQTGLMYMSAAAFGPIFAAYPRRLREIQIFCMCVVGISLIATAFVTKPWHLIVTIGILYPFGGAAYMPAAILLFEWFHAKRGLASGIMYGGTGVGGAIFPLIVSALLKGVGYKATMVSLGVGALIVGNTCIFFIRRRIPLPSRNEAAQARGQAERRHKKVDWSFLTSWTFFAGVSTILVTSLGNFVPSVWLPTFAKDLNLTSPGGTGLVSIMNAASVPGLTLLGHLSDRFPLVWVLGVSCAGTSLSCLFLWGFGTNNALLILFVIAFGLLGLSLSALWTKMISVISRDDPAVPQYVFCVFAFVRGVGNITSGPVSEALLKIDHLRGAAGAYGVNNYGILLVYTGVTIFLGTLTGLPFYGKS